MSIDRFDSTSQTDPPLDVESNDTEFLKWLFDPEWDELCERQSQFDRCNDHVVSLLRRLSPEWTEIDQDRESPQVNQALLILCWAGFVELKVRGHAWTDQTALDFDATVSGLWIDSQRKSILPDEVARGVPAWSGHRVVVQNQSVFKARLTLEGEVTKHDVEADTGSPSFISAFAHQHPTPGRAAVRIIGNETAAPGVVSENYKAADTPGMRRRVAEHDKPAADSQTTKGTKRGRHLGSDQGENLSTDDRAVAVWFRLSRENGKPPSLTSVAHEIKIARQSLYRLPHFMALVKAEKEARETRKSHYPRGTKNRRTGDLEGWKDDRRM
jgi:hypothetical protein